MRFLRLALAMVLVFSGPVWAANTHGTGNTQQEMQAWFGDMLTAYAVSGCLPSTSGTTTLGAFACKAYVVGAANDLVYVDQPSKAVGPLSSGDGTYWVAVHRDTSSTVGSWTRQTGTHYLWIKSATLPATPTGASIIASATVAASAVSAVGDYRQLHPSRTKAFLYADEYGVVCDNSTDNTAAINTLLNAKAATALGTTIIWPVGTCLTTGGHIIPAGIGFLGMGIQRTIIKMTATSGNLFAFTTPTTEATIELGGNSFRDFTIQGTASTDTATGFYIKNKVRMSFHQVEILHFKYGIRGARDNAANSVNSVVFSSMRIRNVKYGIDAIRQWNDITVADSEFQATYIAIFIRDASGFTIRDSSFNGGGTDAGGTDIWVLGSEGVVLERTYHEGTPLGGEFVAWTRNIDDAAATTNNGIAYNTTNVGVISGLRASSPVGTAYAVFVNANPSASPPPAAEAMNLVVIGGYAGSGITTAFGRLASGTRGTIWIQNRPNPGTTVSFQDTADAPFTMNLSTATSTIPAMHSLGLQALTTANADLGDTAVGAPADRSSSGLAAFAAGDQGHVYYDGARNVDGAAILLNFYGYQGGSTRFRNLELYNGKGGLLLNVDGASAQLILQNAVQFRLGTVAAGSLPASSNGTVMYCNDCTIANPCAGGGSGAIAKRLNGAWVCN